MLKRVPLVFSMFSVIKDFDLRSLIPQNVPVYNAVLRDVKITFQVIILNGLTYLTTFDLLLSSNQIVGYVDIRQ